MTRTACLLFLAGLILALGFLMTPELATQAIQPAEVIPVSYSMWMQTVFTWMVIIPIVLGFIVLVERAYTLMSYERSFGETIYCYAVELMFYVLCKVYYFGGCLSWEATKLTLNTISNGVASSVV